MTPIHPQATLEPLPPPENRVIYPAFDGLRAVAVLLVFVYHYVPGTLNWGWIGVDIFFVLSGFLITGILYDSRERVHRYRVFYIRRTLRIFPLYYLVLLVPALLWPVFRWAWHPADWMWLAYLGNYIRLLNPADYVQNHSLFETLQSQSIPWLSLSYDHLWSLSVEEQFYVVWPLVVFTLRGRAAAAQRLPGGGRRSAAAAMGSPAPVLVATAGPWSAVPRDPVAGRRPDAGRRGGAGDAWS